MEAIEFVTEAKDGFIKIPQEYLVNVQGELRVIILVQSKVRPR